jgi:hypothetical protein
MAKSQSESLLRSAKGNKTMPGPGKRPLSFVIARNAMTRQTINLGQPEMRQA